jgi:Cu(I)/Ag(I) efflux system membrane protein CusA/SilA
MIAALLRLCLRNPLVVVLASVGMVFAGLLVAPWDWELGGLPRDPVPVDAIPNLGENQQIVFTEWPGRSPQDVEDQVTYPLTTALLGLPGVETIRSSSMLGFSSIYVIFEEDIDFYWSRSRILEKLNALPSGTLPTGVTPQLGPDATALGQVFWYTLEGRTPEGKPAGGWDLDELRSVQDWLVRYALQGVEGVAEVASVGGFVREYQVDVDPDLLRYYGVTLPEVFAAVQASNRDVGARTMEVNAVEYLVRGVGLLENLEDLRQTVVREVEGVPLTLGEVAEIEFGPAERRGALDKAGAEAVGGVVVTRYGANPLAVIEGVKEKIEAISPGLPAKTLADGTESRLTIVPFYDRTGLIEETLGTLGNALRQQIIVTVLVIVLLLLHLRSAALVASILPLAVLFSFLGMKWFGVEANVVALSGIAIAIGTIVDMGVVLVENILRHLRAAPPDADRGEVVYRACAEVGGAVTTAVLTTVISFLPVFTMEGAEGKLFVPLAYTKTFALLASILLALTLLPVLARWFLAPGKGGQAQRGNSVSPRPRRTRFFRSFRILLAVVVAFLLGLILSGDWAPLGPARPVANAVFVLVVVGGLLGLVGLVLLVYVPVLRFLLRWKAAFTAACGLVLLAGFTAWLGWPAWSGWLPQPVRDSAPSRALANAFPGLGEEFMPDLDEGSFLLMPTTMPHASIGEAMDVLRKQDMAIRAIPEVDMVVGKIGRVESALDPAPVSMVETVISYLPEYRQDAAGNLLTFAYDRERGEFRRDAGGELVPDPRGRPYRQWREEIRSPDDIWDEIVAASRIPGTTSAPKLQPIAARLVMLQSGMRAPMGIKVFGPDLESIETTASRLEERLRQVPAVRAEAVSADEIVGKPYLEIHLDREALARYGIPVDRAQQVIAVAAGGQTATTTVEGRERYPVRIRYPRERRDSLEDLERILLPARGDQRVPLGEVATIEYRAGPQMIRAEDTFLVGYVIFDKREGYAEVEVVEAARDYLADEVASGRLELPSGVSYEFTGSYENQVRAEKRLAVVLPIALLLIFVILHLQFRRIAATGLVFTGILFAWAGGFLMVWAYGQPWFLDFAVFGTNLRALFQIDTVNLSVAVWVGFLALFGIATDNGVIVTTYLQQVFRERRPRTRGEIREATVEAGRRRVRPALLTSATTLLALLPVLTSTGRGAEIMVPMAIPSFGGMLLAVLTIFFVPVLYCGLAEFRQRFRRPAEALPPKSSTNPSSP